MNVPKINLPPIPHWLKTTLVAAGGGAISSISTALFSASR